MKAEGEGHADEALGLDGGAGSEGGSHGIEEGQAKGNSGLLENSAAGEVFLSGDVHGPGITW